jgi:hypothetical protein
VEDRNNSFSAHLYVKARKMAWSIAFDSDENWFRHLLTDGVINEDQIYVYFCIREAPMESFVCGCHVCDLTQQANSCANSKE